MRSPKSADLFFLAHVALIAFSTVAMLTILNGAPSPWLAQEPNATVMRLAWKFSGPTYVVLGALAAIAHAGMRLGWRKALLLLLGASTVSLGAELLGTSTGFPFGEYHYTPLLGYRIAGLVPFPIPLSWFYMIYACLAICGAVTPAHWRRSPWKWSFVAGAVLVAWDVSMDPAMVKTAHWIWGSGNRFREMGFNDALVAFFSRDIFYGMPLSNWLGWFVTGTVIARLSLFVASPSEFAERVSPSRLPVALYAANGIMPVALCLRDELWWAAVFGAIAMLIPIGLAIRARTMARALAPVAA